MDKQFLNVASYICLVAMALVIGLYEIKLPVNASAEELVHEQTTAAASPHVETDYSYESVQDIQNDKLYLRITGLKQKSKEMDTTLIPTKYAALTFDDGPSIYTPQILQILKEYKIRATFFVLGTKANEHPDVIRQIFKEGHVIGNHTWDHPDLTRLSASNQKQEIESTNQLLTSLTGQQPHLLRPPYGSINSNVRTMIQDEEMASVLWNVDPADWNLKLTTPVYERVLSGLKDKNLILLHDGGGVRQKTVDSLPVIIEQLQKQGYEFVTVPEYLALIN